MRSISGAISGALVGAMTLTLLHGSARAQALTDDKVEVRVPSMSAELLDPAGYSRGGVITRATFGDGNDVFSKQAIWSFEARLHVRIIDGLAVSATLPFGLLSPAAGENKFFFGNFNIGVAGGGRLRLGGESSNLADSTRPVLRLGGAVEVYAPTAPKPKDGDLELALAQLAVASIRALEPELYISNIMSFRARAHADITVSIFTGELELGLAPAFTLDSSSDFLMWFSIAPRLSVRAGRVVEPFLEAGSAIQIAGPDPKFSPPFLLTPGVRFHFGAFDPAIFASFNFKESSTIIFGIDISGIVLPTPRSGDDTDSFLRGMED